GELGGDGAAIVLVHVLDQPFADQLLRRAVEELAEHPVGLVEAALAVEQRDADRRVGEEALEALARQAQRLFPLALGRQVADDRAGAQIVAGLHHRLADRGIDDAALPPLEDELAAVRAAERGIEGGVRRRARRRLAIEEILQPGAAMDDLIGSAAEPLRQRLVDEEEAAGAVDRIEADRRVVEEVDELVLLVADDLLHLVPGGDVLQAPEAVAGAAGERMNRNVEPAADVARLADRQRGDGVPAGGDMAEQALKLFLRAAAAFEPFGDRRERRGRRPREQRM